MDSRPRITSLAPKLLAGDEIAVQAIVDAVLGPLCAIARRYGASPEDAEEIAIDAIEKTLRLLPTLSFQSETGKDPLFSYLAKAAHRGTIERARQSAREQAAVATAVERGTIATISPFIEVEARIESPRLPEGPPLSFASDDIKLVTELMSTLAEQDRLLVEMRAHTNWTWEEIAQDVGLTAATARKRWERIRQRFVEKRGAR